MLSTEDNELISRVGPGTLMGNLIREYWVPAMLSSELPHPDCDPVRVLLLGEQLIGFRDTNGRPGLIANLCPHRGASLFFGRNEDCGIRCVYHGWKFDVDGNCVDMPNEPPESNFKNRIKATTYPCIERGGLVWTYMGPRETPPPLPDIEANTTEGFQVLACQRECNWLQAMEGDIDTVHAAFLHGGARQTTDGLTPGTFSYYSAKTKAPRYMAVDTDYGAMYGAYRPAEAGSNYWRIAQWLFPFYTQPPVGVLGYKIATGANVPMDDTHMIRYSISPSGNEHNQAGANPARGYRAMGQGASPSDARNAPGANEVLPNTTDWYGRFRYSQTMENDYMIDRQRQREMKSYTGIPGGGPHSEDQAITESMGPILDRTVEHLGTSDMMIIRVRHRLLAAARALAESNITPPGVDDPEVYRVRSGGIILPESVDWLEGIKGLLPAYTEHPELDITIESGVAP